MTSGPEGRVYAHWKSLKSTWRRNGGNTKSNAIWLILARTHKMPVRQVKDIIAERKHNKEV